MTPSGIRKISVASAALSGLLWLSASASIFGKEPELRGGYPGAFLQFSSDVRLLGLGRSYAGAAGSGAVRNNPAALALPTRSEVGFSHVTLFEDAGLSEVSVSHPLAPPYGLGFSLVHYGISGAVAQDSLNNPGGELTDSRVAAVIGLGYQPLEWMAIGTSQKFINQEIAGASASAWDGDLNLLFIVGPFRAGLGGENLAASSIKRDGGNDRFPRTVRGGFSLRWLKRLVLAADYVKRDKIPSEYHAGLEYEVIAPLSIRVGYDVDALTYGGSLSWKGISFDYAFFRHNVLDVSHRIGIRAGFGPSQDRREQLRGQWWNEHRAKRGLPAKKMPAAALVKSGERLNIAVADLDARNVSEVEASVVADLIRAEFVLTEAYAVVDRRNMEKVLAEQAFQQTGCTTTDCAAQMGKLLNVQVMVVGTLSKLGKRYIISANCINVETGRIEMSDSIESPNQKRLTDAARILARRMSGRLVK